MPLRKQIARQEPHWRRHGRKVRMQTPFVRGILMEKHERKRTEFTQLAHDGLALPFHHGQEIQLVAEPGESKNGGDLLVQMRAQGVLERIHDLDQLLG